MNKDVAILVIEPSTGSRTELVLRPPQERPLRTPWALECSTTDYAASQREWEKTEGEDEENLMASLAPLLLAVIGQSFRPALRWDSLVTFLTNDKER